ncbi:MAG TPA: glycosyltransferase 87 family protein, partial [Actinomycetota bacterium]|nr:glycosyltransferase 87 family protein [Actinomycetota bacterium]
FPVGDQMWQYPPLVGPLLAVGALIPPNPTLGLVLLMLAFDTTTFAVLLRQHERGGSLEGPWAWVAAGMLIGPVWLTRFDVAPALFAVLGLLAVRRPIRAGALFAVGAMLKMWPGLLLLAVPRRGFGRAVLAFGATSLAILGVLLLGMDGAGSFASEQRARGLQVESVPAWGFLVAHHLGWTRHFAYRYGAMEVMAPGVEVVALLVTVTTVLGLAVLALLRWSGRLDHAAPADIALVVVLFSMVTSRVLSPQYLIWVAAVAAVCLLDPGTRMRPVIVLLLPVAALGQILYPMHYDWLLSEGLTGLVLQSIRILLLLAATSWGFARLLRAGGAREVGIDTVEQVRQPA